MVDLSASGTAFILILLGALESIQGQPQCNTSTSNSITLNNEGVFSSIQGAGRVEICYCDEDSTCSWQTVSTGSLTDPFSWKNSIVVCRELGYFDVQSPILQNTVNDANHASASVGIYRTTFNCDGSESSLIDCAAGEGTGSQTHNSDAYVNCQIAAVHTKIRLVGETADSNKGVVEYYSTYFGWSTVCSDYWRTSDANVVCRSLGFASGVSTVYLRSSLQGSEVNTNPAISFISCSSAQISSINSCSIGTQTSICADFTSLAGAECVSSNVAEGTVRQYSISSSAYNRVEVYYAGRWGTVCNSVYMIEEAQVACRELGFTPSLSGIPSLSSPFSGYSPIVNSSRPIWIMVYDCEGSEGNLRSCPRPMFPVGFRSSACSHSNDAGVYCERAPIPPKQLSGGEIAAIAISVTIFVGTFITIIVLYDKHKKGELQPWYRQKKAAFLAWYRPWGRRFSACGHVCCSCCRSVRSRINERRRAQESASRLHEETTHNAAIQLNQVETTPPPAATAPPQTQQQTPPQHPPPTQPQPPLIGFTPNAPPSYDDALHQQHVLPPPPPQYTADDKKELPYPDTEYHPAYPPNV